jgi:G protein-coupled receptor 157
MLVLLAVSQMVDSWTQVFNVETTVSTRGLGASQDGQDWSPVEKHMLEGCVIGMGSLSILGTLIIILTYFVWPDIRSTSRQLLVFLSIADMVTATGNSLGAITHPQGIGCTIQSAFTTTSSLWSFFWTACIALYIFLSVRTSDHTNIYHHRGNTTTSAIHHENTLNSVGVGYLETTTLPLEDKKKETLQLIIYHLVCWGVPIVIIMFALAFEALGGDTFSTTVGWCWISDQVSYQTFWSFFTGKGWEIASYIVTFLLYFFTRRKLRAAYTTPKARMVMDRADRKLMLVPIVFVFVRIWGTVRYLLLLGNVSADKLYWLAVVQGIGDSAQGFANFLLFCVFTPKIRKKFQASLCGWCKCRKDNYIEIDDPSSSRVTLN